LPILFVAGAQWHAKFAMYSGHTKYAQVTYTNNYYYHNDHYYNQLKQHQQYTAKAIFQTSRVIFHSYTIMCSNAGRIHCSNDVPIIIVIIYTLKYDVLSSSNRFFTPLVYMTSCMAAPKNLIKIQLIHSINSQTEEKYFDKQPDIKFPASWNQNLQFTRVSGYSQSQIAIWSMLFFKISAT
jgi:hypothetical protein